MEEIRQRLVVVAEDEPLIRMLAAEVLTDAGFLVIETAHAQQALDTLHARAGNVQLLFTDIQMPGSLNGLDLVHRVWRLWPRIALLIASGNHRPTPDELPPGSRFLPKPYEPDHVVAHARALTLA